MDEKLQAKYEIKCYKNSSEKWVPKVILYLEQAGKDDGWITYELEDADFDYEEQKDAQNHADYMAKDYIITNNYRRADE